MKKKRFLRMLCLLLGLTMLCSLIPQTLAEEGKVVRVGWYESAFHHTDQFGRRSGYGYEYQQRVAIYTGWTYEYVEGSWSELLQKLKDGEIDLLSDVSYKPEREEFMLYPDLPMGTESYYIYISINNREITAENPASLNGKKIGVNKDSIQETFLKEWAEKNGAAINIVPLVVDENESMSMVRDGKLDGYAAVYTMSAEEKTVPILVFIGV